MRILAISQSNNIIGGANRSFLDVLDCLVTIYKHNICVVVPGKGEFTDSLSKLGIKYILANYYQTSSMSYGNWKSIASYMLSIFDCSINKVSAYKLTKKIRYEVFDLIYINDTTNSFGYYLAKYLKTPFVWHFRGYNPKIIRYMTILDEKRLKNDRCGKIIVISKAMREFMVSKRGLSDNSIIVIYNGIKNSGVTIKQPWPDSIEQGFHCLHCGHLSRAKGQVDSIKAIAELKRRGYRNIILHLAGSSSGTHNRTYKAELLALAEKEEVIDNLVFEGEVKDMSILRKTMHVELMCSIAEPFGRVTVEGMQAGLVMIGCDTGATPEIINNEENGLIYKQGNHISLANCIERVYRDPVLGNSLSRNAIEFTKANFTLEKNVKEINEVFLSTVKG